MSLIMSSGDLSENKSKLVDYSSSSDDEDENDDGFQDNFLITHDINNVKCATLKHIKQETEMLEENEEINIPVIRINNSDEDWFNFNLNVNQTLAKPRLKQQILTNEASNDFEIISNGSRRGKDILITGDGYRFLLDKCSKKGKSRYWMCSKKKNLGCGARIVQLSENCIVNRHFHTCTPEFNAKLEIKLKLKTRELATKHPGKTARQVYMEAFKDVLPIGTPMKMPRMENVIRSVNKFKARHVKPIVNKMFKLNHSQLPSDFLQSHIKENNEQLLIFATEEQMNLMQRSTFWLIDCTIKSIDKPFNQLLTFHVFIDHDSSAKLVDVLYVLLTNKQKCCYVTLFNWIKQKFNNNLEVSSMTVDFIEPLWLAGKTVFPNVEINGCLYHWRKSIEKKLLYFGFLPYYREEPDFKNFILDLLSLPFVPKEYIVPIFDDLTQDKQNESTEGFITYIRTHWMSNTFPVEKWSVYNNISLCDVSLSEWNKKLDIFIERRPDLYSFIHFLNENSYKTLEFLAYSQTVSSKLSSQEKEQNLLFKKIKHVWHLFRKGDISAKVMLKTFVEMMAFMNFD